MNPVNTHTPLLMQRNALVGFTLTLLCPHTYADTIDHYLRVEMARNHIPGLEVAIVRKGIIVKLKAYGKANIELGVPMLPDSVSQVASTTKTFTGAALMLLVQEGKCTLDDPITRYLPQAPSEWSKITLRHLATHTSGVPEATGLDTHSTVRDAIAKACRLPLEHLAGERSGYASSDFVLLAGVIEMLSGLSYPEFLRRRIFGPLHMSSTRFDNAVEIGPIRISDLIENRVSVYRWTGTSQTPFSFLYPSHAYAAGGAYSSAHDLARWAVALDHSLFLRAGTRKAMWAPQTLTNGEQTSWGIGWVARTYEGRRVVGHSGGPALSDFLKFPDDGLTVIVLQNQQRMYPYLAQGIADLILPPRPKSSPLAPDRPKLDAAYRALISGLGRGRLNVTLFAKGQEDNIEDVRNLLMPFAESQHPLTCIRLVENKPDVNGRSETYEAAYGRKLILWYVSVDMLGKVTGMNVATP